MSKVKLTIEVEEGQEYEDLKRGIGKADTLRNAKRIEECDDAVSRSAMLDVLLNGNNSFRRVEDIINELPSVTPKREQGEWIFEEVGVRTQVLKCSKCGTIIKKGENFTQEEFKKFINDILRDNCFTLFNFCHNCGAKMKTENEE